MMNTKYKMNGLAKDFGMKPKDFAVYAEKAGLKGKSNMAVLTDEEFDALLTVLTNEFQISDMADYLQRTSYIKVIEEQPAPAPAKVQDRKKQDQDPAPEKKPDEAPKSAEQKKESGAKIPETPVKKNDKPTPPPTPAKSKEEIAAEKQARFKDALQKQMELQAQKQAKQAQKQQEQQKKQQLQTQQQKAAAPSVKEPMTTVTTLEEKSSRVAGTRVVDTRSGGNVDLSKYDEKLEGFVDTNSKQYAGGTQKLKNQNNRQDGK